MAQDGLRQIRNMGIYTAVLASRSAIRADQMARELGYTRAYLCTRFKQEVGVSLTRYVQQEKVAEAKRLLRFTDQELGDISALLGFSSQSHFQTVFKQITGETP